MVVTAGDTDIGVPGPPGFHTNVVAAILLVALKLDDPPRQIAAGVAVGVITGRGLTITCLVMLRAHSPAVGVKV
jgi:hypothetical protein